MFDTPDFLAGNNRKNQLNSPFFAYDLKHFWSINLAARYDDFFVVRGENTC